MRIIYYLATSLLHYLLRPYLYFRIFKKKERLDRLGEVADLGLHEMVEESGVMLVEWGDMAAEILGAHLEVFISRMPDQDDQREIVLTAIGPMWTPRWERVVSAVAPWQVGI